MSFLKDKPIRSALNRLFQGRGLLAGGSLRGRLRARASRGNMQTIEQAFQTQPQLSRQEMVDIVANTKQVRRMAEGLCSIGGEHGTPQYEECVRNMSRRVAEKNLGLR